MRIKFKFWLLIAVIYILAIGGFSVLQYQAKHTELMAEIDQKLLTAAHATRAILGPNFHDKLTTPDAISKAQDYQWGVKLYQFAQSIGVAYVYSFKKFGDDIRFVVSGATEEELRLNTYEPAYHSTYPEMPDAVVRAMSTGQIQTAEYHDRWGRFRSIYLPFTTQDGSPYVIGADISLANSDAVVLESMAFSLLMAVLLTLMLLPLVWLLFKSSKQAMSIKYQAMFVDELTGLPNRNQLLEDLRQARHTHLALIDIRKFNDIINNYGPAIGDHVLKQFACRLDNFSDPRLHRLKAYRLDGDVFALVENHAMTAEDVTACFKRLVNHLVDTHYQVTSEEHIKLRVTIGGVNQNRDAFVLANMALDEAKSRNLPAFVFDNTTQHLPATYRRNIQLQKELQLALDEKRLVPFFQPIFSAHKREIVRYECLARVIDSQGEVAIGPDLFLPVARRVGLYAEITRRMVSQCIAVAQKQQVNLTLNLSIADIMNGETRHFIWQALKNSRVGKRIQFEILENEPITNRRTVVEFIQKAQQLGVRFGIDDLGRSHSNIDRLMSLPLDFIKIDGCIITLIAEDVSTQKVVSELVAIARKNHLKVTAEYCHDEATTLMAEKLGIDYLQGFFLGKPSRAIQ